MLTETSLAAFQSQTPEKIGKDHDRIFMALALGEANYEEIANRIKARDLNTVSRRLKEMEVKGLIKKTGNKSLTSRGRQSFTYEIKERQLKLL